MAARAYWKGYLRLSLVTISVELFSAAKSGRTLVFHQVHKPSEKRVRYQKVAPGIGPVENEDIVKGFEVSKGEYVLLSPEELDAVQLEAKRTIDLVQFVDHCEIDPRYFDKPYYVVPAEDAVAAQGFCVVRNALFDTKKVALGQMAVRGRDYIVAIRPCGDGLLLETLRYADEIVESDKIFRDIPAVAIDEEMVALAQQLIERKSKPFKPAMFKSHYAQAVRDLVERKRKSGKPIDIEEETLAPRGNVINLMEALKKSLTETAKDGAPRRPAAAQKAKAPRRTAPKAAKRAAK
ncbi:MAG: Ku protein [Hyphomonadaceae bacterium]